MTGASPKHLLAMKLEAGRARDMKDTDIHARLYAGKPMKARAVEGLERVSQELKTEQQPSGVKNSTRT